MNPTDLHRIPGLHTEDGGMSVYGALSFPMELDEPYYPVEDSPRVVLAQVTLIGVAVGCFMAALFYFFG